MKRSILFLFVAALAYSCSPKVANIDNSIKPFFEEENVDGSFAIFDNQSGKVTVYNLEADTQRVSPGSIFKIINTLIGLQSSRLVDESSRTGTDSAAGPTLKEAFDTGDDNFFRNLAGNIGHDTLQFWIDTVNYGNMQINEANTFWNDGTLKISPDEQLGLMFKIYFDKLPFQKYAHQLVRDLLVKEDNTLYIYAYTTGSALADDGSPLGWIAGWIEENRHVYFFSCLIKSDDKDKNLEQTAADLSRKIFKSKGFFKGEK